MNQNPPRRRRTPRTAVILLAVATMLAAGACSSSDEAATTSTSRAAADATMTTEQARDWYAELGCNNYAGYTAYATALAAQPSTEPGTPVDPSMQPGATQYRDALLAFEDHLDEPPGAWPTDVADDIEVLRTYNNTLIVPFLDALLVDGAVWPEPIPAEANDRSRDASTEIRRLLGAPAFGEGC